MNQVITQGGLRINDLNTNLTSNAISDTQEPDSTVDVLSDLEKMYYDFKAKSDYKEYLTMTECLSKVLKGSFKSVNDLVECQITNGDLDQSGWQFLLQVVEYLCDESELDLNNKAEAQELDKRRVRISSYLSYPTFKSSVRGEDMSDDEKLSLSKRRQSEMEAVFKRTGYDTYQADIIDKFVAVTYPDILLTTNIVRLFFVGK